jgi:NADH-quinone oxidoreductase subunit F
MAAQETRMVSKFLRERPDDSWQFDIARQHNNAYGTLDKAFSMDPDAVVEEVKTSGLRGKGGAGFGCGQKWSLVPKDVFPRYLAVNGDEGEPCTFKDHMLVERDPHQIVEGAIVAAYAIKAHHAFIYLRGEFALGAERLGKAIEDAYAHGFLGRNILGSGYDLELTLHRGAGCYIAGDETGLLSSLEGERAMPRTKPPFPAVQGVYASPTIVNNVETISSVPHIIRNGGEWYASMGEGRSTGTRIFSVSGSVQRPGNYEVELGVPSREIIYGLAGGPDEGRAIKCWFPGGSSSPVLPGTDEFLDLPYDFDSMAKAGSMLGSGAIIVVDESIPIIDVALKTAKFYRHESCGKCTPCREGTNWTVKMLERIDSGEATPMDLDIMASVQDQIMGNCLCVLGDAMAMPIASMIQHFRDEFEAHIEAARERSGLGVSVPLVNRDDHAGPGPLLQPDGGEPRAAVV